MSQFSITESLTFRFSQAYKSLPHFDHLFKVWEKVQVTVTTVEELIISGIYIYETNRLIKHDQLLNTKSAKKVLQHLIYVNIAVMLMDIAIVATDYTDYYWIQLSMKAPIYTYKLRLEFSILNKLTDMLKASRNLNSFRDSRYLGSNVDSNGFRKRGTYTVSAQKSNLRTVHEDEGVILATTDVEVNSTDAICVHKATNSMGSFPDDFPLDEIYAGPGSVLPPPCSHCGNRGKQYDEDGD